jgi:hypothetical protein
VVSKSPVRISRFRRDTPILPTYVAQFTVRWHFARPDDPNTTNLLKTPVGMTLSDLQKKFLRGNELNWLWSHDLDAIYDDEMMGLIGFEVKRKQGHVSYHAYAVSEKDAFKIAVALVEFLAETGTEKARRGMRQHIEKLSERQRQLRAKITDMKKEAAAKDEEKESAYEEYEQAVRGSLYTLQRISNVPNELRQTILEMNKMLDILNIEIVGIKSKISAIKKHSKQEEELGRGTLVMALKEMEIREEIELAGAESRRQAIINIKERQKILLDLHKRFLVLEQEAGELGGSINRYESNMKMIEKELNRWNSRELLFQVENDNKVFIRPLRIK